MEKRHLAIRVMLLPKDTNAHGTIFGGVILSQIDLAGAVEARRHTEQRVVTVAMKEVEFHAPVMVGDVVSFWTRLERTGRSSITVHVEVESERSSPPHARVRVTVGPDGAKVPVISLAPVPGGDPE